MVGGGGKGCDFLGEGLVQLLDVVLRVDKKTDLLKDFSGYANELLGVHFIGLLRNIVYCIDDLSVL